MNSSDLKRGGANYIPFFSKLFLDKEPTKEDDPLIAESIF